MEKQATSSKRSLSSAPQIKEVPVGIENHEDIQRGVPEFGGENQKGYFRDLENTLKIYTKQKYELEMMLANVQYDNQKLRQCLLEKNKAKDLENRVKDLKNKKSELEEEVYVSELQNIAKEMEKAISEVKEKVSNVEKENQMLKDSLMNSTGQMRGAGGSNA